jgi:thioredoxin-related protein
MDTMTKVLFAFALALPPSLAFGDDTGGNALRWETSFPKALERAGKEKRLMVVDFWRDNCVYCTRMETETFRDPRVIQLLSNYVPARIKNTEHPVEIEKYKVDGYPTLAILDHQGNPIDIFAGYQPAGAFMSWLATNADRHLRYQELEARIARDGSDLAARLALGKLYSGDGQRAKARECLEALIKADPSGKRHETGEAHLEVGLTWRRSREYRQAAESISHAREIAIALQPPGGKAGDGKTAEAKTAADFLERTLYELGVTHLLAGSRKELVAVLEEYDSRVTTPDARRHAWVLLRLGQARQKDGAEEAAKRAFDRLEALYPRSPEAREARGNQ